MNKSNIHGTPDFSILNSFPNYICVIDKNADVVYINSAWQNRDKTDIDYLNIEIQCNYLEVCKNLEYSHDNAIEIYTGIQNVMDGRAEKFKMDYTCEYHKASKWYSVEVKRIIDFNDYFIVIHSDITKCNAEKSKFEIYKDKMTSIFRNNPSILLLVDSDTAAILDANIAACDFYGYSEDAMRKMSMLQLSPIDDTKQYEFIQWKNKFLKHGCFEQSHRLSNGRPIDVEVHSMLIHYMGREGYMYTINDITQKKRVRRYLKDNQEKYRALVELSPDAIFILDKDKFVFANPSGLKMMNLDNVYELLCVKIRNLLDWSEPHNSKLYELIGNVITNNLTVKASEHKIVARNGKSQYIEISATPVNYRGQQFVQLVAKDITERKRELERAYKLEIQRLSSRFPIENAAEMQSVYIPANGVSGDFFKVQKIDESNAIGLIGDVSGKGVTAALNTSVLNVLFNNGTSISSNPSEVLNYMNRQMIKHFNEEYIAACCFRFDFKNKILNVAAAGINHIVVIKNGNSWINIDIKGSFLGMFGDCLSEEISVEFDSGDVFFFYTDGMDFVLEDEENKDKILKVKTLSELKEGIKKLLISRQILDDDASWLGIQIL